MLSLKYEILKKGINLLSDEMINNIGKVENLKLYDIAFDANVEDYDKYFNLFCEDNYDYFQEIEKDNYTDRSYIGKTSSFYIISSNRNIIGSYYFMNEYENLTPFKKKILLLNEYLNHEISSSLDIYELQASVFDDEIRSFYDNYSDDEILSDILKGIKSDLIDEINDINKTYEYISYFKNNQMEHWNEFVKYCNENEIN